MLLLATLLFAQSATSLFKTVIPNATGENGYEEYVRAAEIVLAPEARLYADWQPGALPPSAGYVEDEKTGEFAAAPPKPDLVAIYRRLNGMTPLDVRREELSKFGRALDLVHVGNAKPAFDPRPDAGPDTLFPQFAAFKALTRFAARAATVYAADGRTDRATEVLLDQLLFADTFGRSVLIANLVATATTSMTLASFGELLPRLSRVDAVKIERGVGAILTRPVAARAVLPAEFEFAKTGLRLMAASGDTKGLFYDPDDEQASAASKAMAQEFAAMSQTQRKALLRGVESRLERRAAEMDRIFAGPEGKWEADIATLDADESPSDIEGNVMAMLTPVYCGYAGVAARSRTQLRLLDLHARLIEYRWDFGHYPESIDTPDPLNGGKYVYERRVDGTIRLASKGLPSTGEIELKYKRPSPPVETGSKP